MILRHNDYPKSILLFLSLKKCYSNSSFSKCILQVLCCSDYRSGLISIHVCFLKQLTRSTTTLGLYFKEVFHKDGIASFLTISNQYNQILKWYEIQWVTILHHTFATWDLLFSLHGSSSLSLIQLYVQNFQTFIQLTCQRWGKFKTYDLLCQQCDPQQTLQYYITSKIDCCPHMINVTCILEHHSPNIKSKYASF